MYIIIVEDKQTKSTLILLIVSCYYNNLQAINELKKMTHFFNMKLFANNCHVEVIEIFGTKSMKLNNGNGK